MNESSGKDQFALVDRLHSNAPVLTIFEGISSFSNYFSSATDLTITLTSYWGFITTTSSTNAQDKILTPSRTQHGIPMQ